MTCNYDTDPSLASMPRGPLSCLSAWLRLHWGTQATALFSVLLNRCSSDSKQWIGASGKIVRTKIDETRDAGEEDVEEDGAEGHTIEESQEVGAAAASTGDVIIPSIEGGHSADLSNDVHYQCTKRARDASSHTMYATTPVPAGDAQ